MPASTPILHMACRLVLLDLNRSGTLRCSYSDGFLNLINLFQLTPFYIILGHKAGQKPMPVTCCRRDALAECEPKNVFFLQRIRRLLTMPHAQYHSCECDGCCTGTSPHGSFTLLLMHIVSNTSMNSSWNRDLNTIWFCSRCNIKSD